MIALALTSTICRTLQRIPKIRLLNYLSGHAYFDRTHAGGLRRCCGDSMTQHSGKKEIHERGACYFVVPHCRYLRLTWKHWVLRDVRYLKPRGRLS